MSGPELDPLAHAALAALPDIPRDREGPVFREPWEAQAFAMTLALHEKGLFTWPEWTDIFSAQIKADQKAGDPDLGDTYYLHWLRALEVLVARKGLASEAGLGAMKQAWDRAAKATPHGQPIVLGAEKS